MGAIADTKHQLFLLFFVMVHIYISLSETAFGSFFFSHLQQKKKNIFKADNQNPLSSFLGVFFLLLPHSFTAQTGAHHRRVTVP